MPACAKGKKKRWRIRSIDLRCISNLLVLEIPLCEIERRSAEGIASNMEWFKPERTPR
jgi:hypothetical protein